MKECEIHEWGILQLQKGEEGKREAEGSKGGAPSGG